MTETSIEIETIEDLTNNLVEVKNNILNGHIELERAKEFNNTAGKILGTIKLQLAYQALTLAFKSRSMSVPNIPYLESPKCLTGE